MQQAGHNFDFKFFDIDASLQNLGTARSGAQKQTIASQLNSAGQARTIELRDSIADFPAGFEAAVTNPPYLSFHFAKRKGLNPAKEYFEGFESLYQTSISKALTHCDYVAMIIPESFITSGLFAERLQSVISLPFVMFNDTDMPTCLALWGPQITGDYELWRGGELLGLASELTSRLLATNCKSRIVFNHPDGNLGFRAIDNSHQASINFCPKEDIPLQKVKHSARLLTRIRVENLSDPLELISLVNQKIDDWRESTQDICLTAFKGLRKDGRFRRRLDYANARALLSQALCELEDHRH